jgi:hypothetical protein
MNTNLKLFKQVHIGKQFHYGDKPNEAWLKISETQATKRQNVSYPRDVWEGKWVTINPGVLVIAKL